jgi:hypothetical protein
MEGLCRSLTVEWDFSREYHIDQFADGPIAAAGSGDQIGLAERRGTGIGGRG